MKATTSISHPLTHSVTQSLTHSVSQSLTHSLTHSQTDVRERDEGDDSREVQQAQGHLQGFPGQFHVETLILYKLGFNKI